MEGGKKLKKNHIIDLKSITKEYDGQTVLDNISFYVRKNEFVTLLGPSGCGKTTTLRIIEDLNSQQKVRYIRRGRYYKPAPLQKTD